MKLGKGETISCAQKHMDHVLYNAFLDPYTGINNRKLISSAHYGVQIKLSNLCSIPEDA